MINIFIIDDEMLIRMGIKMMNDWNKAGISIIGEASNGKEAIDKIKALQPDIVITDLIMPVMDGISLIKELKRIKFNGKIIVLSNYNEFDLVKEAMKNGASEYLLKVTLDSNELIGLIKSLSEDLINQKKEESVNSKIKIELNENKSVIKEKLLNSIKNGSITPEEIQSKIQFYNLKVAANSVAVAAIIDNFDSSLIKSRLKDENLLNFTIENIIDEVINRKNRGEVFFLKKGLFIILLDAKDFDQAAKTSVKDLTLEIKTLLKRYLYVDSYFIFRNSIIHAENLCMAINNIIAMQEQTFFSEGVYILEPDKCMYQINTIDDDFWKLKHELKEVIDIDPEHTITLINQIFDLMNERRYPKTAANQIFRNLITLFEEAAIKENGDLYKVIDRNIILQAETIVSMESFKAVMTEICGKAVSLIIALKNERFRGDVLKAVNFIKSNYKEKISLEDTALHVNMNKNYFCKLFKDETGLSPVEYIINYKIEKAKELLKKGDIKVNDVAKTMGYDDVSYFNRLFKKHVGVSPGSYIK